jgi:hypothetical protein
VMLRHNSEWPILSSRALPSFLGRLGGSKYLVACGFVCDVTAPLQLVSAGKADKRAMRHRHLPPRTIAVVTVGA